MCPACGASLTDVLPSGVAVVSGSSGGARAEGPRPRFVSRAGNALPVPKPTDDTTPSSWMARLQAAKRIGVEEEADEGDPAGRDAPAPAPPPLPAAKAPPPKAERPSAKPAHLLVAELAEEEERDKRPALPRAGSSVEAIAALDVAKPLPTVAPKRRLPTSVTVGIVAVVVLAAVGGAYWKAKQEPALPKQEVNPELLAKKKRLEQALDALEDGHVLFRQRKSDEAIASYKKALELEPTLAKAERGLGIAYAAKGDKKQAVGHYRRYLELDKTAQDADEVKKIIEKIAKEGASP